MIRACATRWRSDRAVRDAPNMIGQPCAPRAPTYRAGVSLTAVRNLPHSLLPRLRHSENLRIHTPHLCLSPHFKRQSGKGSPILCTTQINYGAGYERNRPLTERRRVAGLLVG